MPRRAVMDTSLSPTDFKVLAIIGLYLNHDHEAWPMQETIGETGAMSKSTVSRSIKRLEEAGYIISRKKYPNQPGTHKCYAVILDETGLDDTPGNVKSDTSGNVTSATPELHHRCNSGISSMDATPIRTNPIELSHKNICGSDEPVELAFNKIWAAWSGVGRKRSKKIPLLKAQLKRLAKTHDLEKVTRAALMYAKATDGGYHKALDRWLAGGYYENWVGKSPELLRAKAEKPVDQLAWCFETYAKTGEWNGDRHGYALKPEHPKAKYPSELYSRFGLTKEIAA